MEETLKLGEEIAGNLKGGEVIILDGDLGAGKTVVAKGIAKGLGVNAIVNSPTFTIVNIYQGRLKFCHFDMYRIEDEEEVRELGFEELIGANDNVCAVEWASRTPSLMPDNAIKITINKVDEQKRDITIEGL